MDLSSFPSFVWWMLKNAWPSSLFYVGELRKLHSKFPSSTVSIVDRQWIESEHHEFNYDAFLCLIVFFKLQRQFSPGKEWNLRRNTQKKRIGFMTNENPSVNVPERRLWILTQMVPSQIRPTSSSHELATNTSILTVVNPVFISAKNASYVHCKKVLLKSSVLEALLRDDADTYERAPEFARKVLFATVQ